MARPPGVEHAAPCHSNLMQIDETAMATGIALHVAVARAYLTTLASGSLRAPERLPAA